MTPRWNAVADSFRVDGSIMLLWVDGPASMSIWQQAVDWLGRDGGRYMERGSVGTPSPVPSAKEIFRRRQTLATPYLQSFGGSLAPGIRAWLHFSQFDPLWMSVTQEDVQSQGQLDVLCGGMLAFGRVLCRDLTLTPEWAGPLTGTYLRYSLDQDTVLYTRSPRDSAPKNG